MTFVENIEKPKSYRSSKIGSKSNSADEQEGGGGASGVGGGGREGSGRFGGPIKAVSEEAVAVAATTTELK